MVTIWCHLISFEITIRFWFSFTLSMPTLQSRIKPIENKTKQKKSHLNQISPLLQCTVLEYISVSNITASIWFEGSPLFVKLRIRITTTKHHLLRKLAFSFEHKLFAIFMSLIFVSCWALASSPQSTQALEFEVWLVPRREKKKTTNTWFEETDKMRYNKGLKLYWFGDKNFHLSS